jgi:hypothetical protein
LPFQAVAGKRRRLFLRLGTVAGARVCDPQQFPNFKQSRIRFENHELAKSLRVTDPRSGYFGCSIYENALMTRQPRLLDYPAGHFCIME